jgi:hypothetical protein
MIAEHLAISFPRENDEFEVTITPPSIVHAGVVEIGHDCPVDTNLPNTCLFSGWILPTACGSIHLRHVAHGFHRQALRNRVPKGAK